MIHSQCNFLIRLFGSCLTLATKYYEENGFVNIDGFKYVSDKHFAVATLLEAKELGEFQVEVLKTIDYRLFIDEEEWGRVSQEFIRFREELI